MRCLRLGDASQVLTWWQERAQTGKKLIGGYIEHTFAHYKFRDETL